MESNSLHHVQVYVVILAVLTLNGCALMGEEATPDTIPYDDRYGDDPVTQSALGVRNQVATSSSGDRQPASVKAGGTFALDNSAPLTLTLGMSQGNVRSLWGSPQDVEFAGSHDSGYERWIYLNGIGSGWGTSDSRVVYFEQGHVVGWENRR